MKKVLVLIFVLLSVRVFATDCRTTYGISPSIIATASCDINVNDKTVGGNATGGAITFTLDNCASSTKDVTHFFWKTDSSGNAVTLDGYSAQTINGSSTFALPTQYTAARLRCQGNGNWIIESGSLSVIGSGSIGSGSITPGADDTMLISNGSVFQDKTIPSCTDTGGNHLNYDQSTNSLSCGTSGGGGLTIGSTTITSGTNTYLLYDNAGTLGEYQKVPLANGGTNADLSATGGTSQVLKQTSAGGAVTVGQLQCSDLSDAAAGCSTGSAPPTFVGVYASNVSAVSYSNNTFTSLTLSDADAYDSNNFHFTSSANLTGTVSKTATSANITGSSTTFTTELTVNQVISIPGTAAETCVVKTITDNTHIVCWQTMANTASGQTATRRNNVMAIPINYNGYYMVCGGISWAFVSTTDATSRALRPLVNGTAQNTAAQVGAVRDNGISTNITGCWQIKVSDGDYVELSTRQISGGNLNGSDATMTLELIGQ